jgi:hypothetical protein
VKAFKNVLNFPDMVKWLEGDADAGTDLEVWGVTKNRYVFVDLIAYVKRGGPVVEGSEDGGEVSQSLEWPIKSKRKAKEEKGSAKKKGKQVVHKRRIS